MLFAQAGKVCAPIMGICTAAPSAARQRHPACRHSRRQGRQGSRSACRTRACTAVRTWRQAEGTVPASPVLASAAELQQQGGWLRPGPALAAPCLVVCPPWLASRARVCTAKPSAAELDLPAGLPADARSLAAVAASVPPCMPADHRTSVRHQRQLAACVWGARRHTGRPADAEVEPPDPPACVRLRPLSSWHALPRPAGTRPIHQWLCRARQAEHAGPGLGRATCDPCARGPDAGPKRQ